MPLPGTARAPPHLRQVRARCSGRRVRPARGGAAVPRCAAFLSGSWVPRHARVGARKCQGGGFCSPL
eukprot:5444985-Pyramimonas_sp.AAC.1